MRILITGAGGFVGHHLAAHLAQCHPGAQLHGTVFRQSERAPHHVRPHVIDLRDVSAVDTLIEAIQPDQIYHLAAQAFVPRSFEDPWETLQNNIQSQLHITTASLKLPRPPLMLVVTSAEIYGIVTPDELPLSESAEMRPTSPYSVSKIAQDMLAFQYHISHKLPITRARPFNHFGPGQNDRFVAPAFAMQIARIEAGQQAPVMRVGDLSARRDFTDVRDIVRAYRLIAEQGDPGGVYNVSSGQTHSIQALLDGLLRLSNTAITIETDPARLRQASVPVLQGDCSRLRETTGWRPEITFEQSLIDILNDCRQRVRSEQTN